MIEFDEGCNAYYIFRDGQYTYLEDAMMADKAAYALQVRELSQELAEVVVKLRDMAEIWDARFYGPGGKGEIKDADVSLESLTANDLLEWVYAVNDLTALMKTKTIFNRARRLK